MSRGARFLKHLHNKIRAKKVLSKTLNNSRKIGPCCRSTIVKSGPVTDSVSLTSVTSDNFCECKHEQIVSAKRERMEISLHPLEVAEC